MYQIPDIAVTYNEHCSSDPFQEFADVVRVESLRLVVCPIPDSSANACIEWFMIPLAGAVFFAKSYFDGFLKEAGREHYQGLKKSLAHHPQFVPTITQQCRIQVCSASKPDSAHERPVHE